MQPQAVALFSLRAFRDNRPMRLRIVRQKDWLISAESTDARPVCVFCSWYELHTIRIGNDAPLEEWYCPASHSRLARLSHLPLVHARAWSG
jgi:hypothetical protein